MLDNVVLLREAVQKTGDAYLRAALAPNLPNDIILEAKFDNDGFCVIRLRDQGSGEDLTGPIVIEDV